MSLFAPLRLARLGLRGRAVARVQPATRSHVSVVFVARYMLSEPARGFATKQKKKFTPRTDSNAAKYDSQPQKNAAAAPQTGTQSSKSETPTHPASEPASESPVHAAASDSTSESVPLSAQHSTRAEAETFTDAPALGLAHEPRSSVSATDADSAAQTPAAFSATAADSAEQTPAVAATESPASTAEPSLASIAEPSSAPPSEPPADPVSSPPRAAVEATPPSSPYALPAAPPFGLSMNTGQPDGLPYPEFQTVRYDGPEGRPPFTSPRQYGLEVNPDPKAPAFRAPAPELPFKPHLGPDGKPQTILHFTSGHFDRLEGPPGQTSDPFSRITYVPSVGPEPVTVEQVKNMNAKESLARIGLVPPVHRPDPSRPPLSPEQRAALWNSRLGSIVNPFSVLLFIILSAAGSALYSAYLNANEVEETEDVPLLSILRLSAPTAEVRAAVRHTQYRAVEFSLPRQLVVQAGSTVSVNELAFFYLFETPILTRYLTLLGVRRLDCTSLTARHFAVGQRIGPAIVSARTQNGVLISNPGTVFGDVHVSVELHHAGSTPTEERFVACVGIAVVNPDPLPVPLEAAFSALLPIDSFLSRVTIGKAIRRLQQRIGAPLRAPYRPGAAPSPVLQAARS